MKKNNDNKANQPEVVGFVGVGLDCDDEHKRITQGENFLLVGGSEETHEHMIDVSIQINEDLSKRGKRLQAASLEELADIFHNASAKNNQAK